jgi:transposase
MWYTTARNFNRWQAEYILADRGYDSQKLIDFIEQEMGSIAVIPSRCTNKEQRDYDRRLFKERHLVECFLIKSSNIAELLHVMKNWRRLI